MEIHLYKKEYKSIWDNFVANSKNGIFLYFRDYMEYHSDRFEDFSLIFLDEKQTVTAIMPANIGGDTITSHGGLTFGGIVSDTCMTTPKMLEAFSCLRDFLKERGIKTLRYKAVPHIYHTIPAEEDLYALFVNGAKLRKREVSTSILMSAPLAFTKRRQRGISKAQKSGIMVRETKDFSAFMQIVKEVLGTRHGVQPVHSTNEISYLASLFPENVRLFSAFLEDKMCAGVIIYSGHNVAHAQYIAANEIGRNCSALDMIFDCLINNYFCKTKYFDFGISTENNGTYLNNGLIDHKEMFGGRAVVHDTYEVNI